MKNNKKTKRTAKIIFVVLSLVIVLTFSVVPAFAATTSKPLDEVAVTVNQANLQLWLDGINDEFVAYENAYWIPEAMIDDGINLHFYGIRVTFDDYMVNPDTYHYDVRSAEYEHAIFDRDFPMYPISETAILLYGSYHPATNTSLRPWYGSYTDNFIGSFSSLLIAESPSVTESEAYQQGVADTYSQQFKDMTDSIDHGGNWGEGAIRGFFSGLTGAATTVLNGVTIGGISLMAFVASCCFILLAAFVIKVVKK